MEHARQAGRPKRQATLVTATFSKRLEKLVDNYKATHNGATQGAIAKKIGISQANLSDWLNNNKTPDINSLYNVAAFFNVSTDYLLGLSNVKNVNDNAQAAGKVTGLTGKAIAILSRKFKPTTPEQAESAITDGEPAQRIWTIEEHNMLSKMIESGAILAIVSNVCKFQKLIALDAQKRSRYQRTGEKGDGLTLGITSGGAEIITSTVFSEQAELAQYRAEKAVTIYTEKLHDDITKESRRQ